MGRCLVIYCPPIHTVNRPTILPTRRVNVKECAIKLQNNSKYIEISNTQFSRSSIICGEQRSSMLKWGISFLLQGNKDAMNTPKHWNIPIFLTHKRTYKKVMWHLLPTLKITTRLTVTLGYPPAILTYLELFSGRSCLRSFVLHKALPKLCRSLSFLGRPFIIMPRRNIFSEARNLGLSFSHGKSCGDRNFPIGN